MKSFSPLNCVVTLLLVVLAVSIVRSPDFVTCGSPPDQKTTERLTNFTVSNVRVAEFARELTKATGLRICVEEARYYATKEDSEETKAELNVRGEGGLTIEIVEGSIYDALDRLVEIEPRYTWSHDPFTSTLNIYPVENAPLGWVIPPLSIHNETMLDVIVKEDLLGLREKKVFVWTRGRATWLGSHVSLEAPQGLTAREALNRLCAQLDFHAPWSVPARWQVYDESIEGAVKYKLMIVGMYRPGVGPLQMESNKIERKDD